MLVVETSIKDRFFDRAKVVSSLRAADRRRLSKIGAYVRTRAQKGILRRGPKRRGPDGRTRSSRPGQPPYVWSNDTFATLKNILFGLTNDENAVLIGPRRVNSLRLKRSSAQTVPELMEKGGTSSIYVDERTGDATFGPNPNGSTRIRSVKYQPRPFMGPALQAEIAKGTIASVWDARVS